MEIVKVVEIAALIIEGIYICKKLYERNQLIKENNLTIKLLEEMNKMEKKNIFADPLGEGYRKNKKGQYTPIKPYKENKDEV